MRYFDWSGLMQLGMCELRLKPHEFWVLTPLELLIISGLEERKLATMTRADLTGLYAQFPDDETE